MTDARPSAAFGFLTLATPDDYQKAIGLALSLRISNPGIPVAIACSPTLKPLIAPYFDIVVDENPALRGFIHKLHLDRYSPFEETFFFDSDVLVFRPIAEVLDKWRAQPYAACGSYGTGGKSAFGLDVAKVLRTIGHDRLVQIDGAGHAYFRKPDCHAIFDRAREIASDYPRYAGNIRLADEDVMDIAMTQLDLRPMPHGDFFSCYWSARKGTIAMDAVQGKCHFVSAVSGEVLHPYMMHFAGDQAPFLYSGQLRKLFRRFGVSTQGLLKVALADYYLWGIEFRVKQFVKGLMRTVGLHRAV